MNIGLIYAIGAAVVWGMVYAIDQKLLEGTSTIILIFIGSLTTTILMLPFMYFHEQEALKDLFFSGKVNMYVLTLSIVLGSLASFFIYESIRLIGASPASILEIAYPFFVILFTFIFFGTAPNIYFVIGGILIFSGAAIISYFG